MSGPIPKELKELHELKYLDLSSNDLTGTVPPELSVLQKLGRSFQLVCYFLFHHIVSHVFYDAHSYRNNHIGHQ